MQTEWSRGNDDMPTEGSSQRSPWAPTTPDSSSAPGPTDIAAVPGDPPAPEDAPEVAMAPGEEELHRSAVDAVDGLLDEVELALTRLDDGTYGRCEECGEPIDDDRLAELPIIRTCAKCAPAAGATGGEDSSKISVSGTHAIEADRREAPTASAPWSSGL